MPHISIVSPIYNEASATISTLVDTLVHALAEITDDYEIILVDDGSRNDAWESICAMSTENSSVKGIRLARNFGQHSAIAAGLDHTSGDWVVVMDSDLQDRPEVIPELYRTAENGHDVVFVDRRARPEGIVYRFLAAAFYKVFNFLAGQEYQRRQGNFSIISRNVVDALSGSIEFWNDLRTVLQIEIHRPRPNRLMCGPARRQWRSVDRNCARDECL